MKIEDLKKEDLVEFYHSQTGKWTIENIIKFQDRVNFFIFEEANIITDREPFWLDFYDYGFDGWLIETKTGESWDGLDIELEKRFGLDIDALAKDSEFHFIVQCNDEVVLFNREMYEDIEDESLVLFSK